MYYGLVQHWQGHRFDLAASPLVIRQLHTHTRFATLALGKATLVEKALDFLESPLQLLQGARVQPEPLAGSRPGLLACSAYLWALRGFTCQVAVMHGSALVFRVLAHHDAGLCAANTSSTLRGGELVDGMRSEARDASVLIANHALSRPLSMTWSTCSMVMDDSRAFVMAMIFAPRDACATLNSSMVVSDVTANSSLAFLEAATFICCASF